MRIVSDGSGCRALFPDGRAAECLRTLALGCGYRAGELAGALGCSGSYLRRVFARDLGVTPKRWLRGERMRAAGRLLGAGMPPWQAVEALGFAPGSGFRREFRKTHGITPGEYARRRV